MLKSLLALALLAPPSLAQTTWFVDGSATPPGLGTAQDPYASLAYAMEQAATQNGDSLLVAAGTYAESVDMLGKDVTVAPMGPAGSVEFVGDGQGSVFRFASGESPACVLQGLVIRGTAGTLVAGSTYGGGILIQGASPTLLDLDLVDSFAERGGALAILGGSPLLAQSRIEGNGASIGAGVYLGMGELVVESCHFESNAAGTLSGIVPAGGGGIASQAGSTLTVRSSEFLANRTERGNGAGIFCEGMGQLEQCTFRNNLTGSPTFTAGAGGGVFASAFTTGMDCHFEGNGWLYTTDGGGAIGGRWFFSTFRDNHCYCSGAGLAYAIAEDCWIVNNSHQTEGGPACGGGGAANSYLLRCRVEGNRCLGFSGAGTSNCDLVDCCVLGNRFEQLDGFGGGIAGGSAQRCQILENDATVGGTGGGAYNADLSQCLLLRNRASAVGGAYDCNLDRCTVLQNYAFVGLGPNDPPVGGVVSSLPSKTVDSSIVWGNVGDELGGSPSLSYTTVEGGAPGLGNLDLDPLFFGPGSDLHLTARSPCIDAGNPAAPLDPDGSRADMGALPFDSAWTQGNAPFCLGDFSLRLSGTPSLSGPAASLQGAQVDLFLVGIQAGTTPIQLGSGFPASFLCFSRGIRRLAPSGPGRLDLSPALLTSLGLQAGDRFYVAAWTMQGKTSYSWDLGVAP